MGAPLTPVADCRNCRRRWIAAREERRKRGDGGLKRLAGWPVKGGWLARLAWRRSLKTAGFQPQSRIRRSLA